ncbi:DMT family transporter [Lonepinella sp. BR2271]|uniref:DMT family transporter n=1 Tax=Lonepinella sp. BR2271 TaxID=3434550 RepID=UPI003F6DE876
MLWISFALFIGAGIALQTAINAKLRLAVSSPFIASNISFLVGTLCLFCFGLLSAQSFLVDTQSLANTPFWMWLGGFLGTIALTTNILLFPHLGGVQTVIMVILGQVSMGLIIDHFSLFHTPQYAFSLSRLLGAILLLSGIFLVVRRPKMSHTPQTTSSLWLWRIIGIVAGGMGAMQTAINGALGHELHSPLLSALISFAVGTLCLFLFINAQRQPILPALHQAAKAKLPTWVWFGGSLGALFVFGNVLLVPELGTGQTVIFALAGMIIGSQCIDHFGILGAVKKPLQLMQFIGLVLLLTGIAIIRLY